jgi:uncharacterized membrane protein HdeD (DUF308 family)
MGFANVWGVLEIIAGISIIISFFIGKNAVWGMLTLGVIVAAIIGFIFKDDGFNWELFTRTITISVLIGTFFELLGRLTNYRNKKL